MLKKYKNIILRIIVTLSIFIVMLVLDKVFKYEYPNNYIECGIYICIYIIIGYDVLIKAFRNVFRKDFLDENFLMSIASICAFFVAEYSEAIAVMLLYQIGELFQKIAVNNSRKSIAELIDICPDCTSVVDSIDGENEREVDSEDVEIGSYIIIKPGERIPLDCIVKKGESLIDYSTLTGEPVPKRVSVNDELLSGAINTSNVIIAKTIKEYDESTATKILELVENASDRKSKSESFISRFAKCYTPIVVGCALIIALVPTIIGGKNVGGWITRACIFLITSCPCALVISVPLSFFGGIGAASKRGVLVKGSDYLEKLSKVDIFLFDKTGTLTKGNFRVSKVNINKEEITKERFFELLYIAESKSNHPIAKAVTVYIEEMSYNYEDINNDCIITEVAGKGMVVNNGTDVIFVGNKALLEEHNIENIEECSLVGTVIYVAFNNEYIGYILISDEVKEFSKDVINKLNKCGIKKTVMLTGDKKVVGENIAKQLGLSDVYTELLPQDKVNIIEEIISKQKNNSLVAYVGDGINDAPVLARADVGISMGGVASDVAIEASDIVLMDDNLFKIVDAINISKKTMNIVKQNIVFSLTIKAIVLLLGAIGIANMWMAIFADVGVMIIAILNAIRVLKCKNV